MQIRDAVEADFEAITAKYNDVLTNSTAIYNDRPATVEDRIAWWRTRLEQHSGFREIRCDDRRMWQQRFAQRTDSCAIEQCIATLRHHHRIQHDMIRPPMRQALGQRFDDRRLP